MNQVIVKYILIILTIKFIKNVVKEQDKQQQEVVALTMALEQQHQQQLIKIDIQDHLVEQKQVKRHVVLILKLFMVPLEVVVPHVVEEHNQEQKRLMDVMVQ